jgi:hypothetical protein
MTHECEVKTVILRMYGIVIQNRRPPFGFLGAFVQELLLPTGNGSRSPLFHLLLIPLLGLLAAPFSRLLRHHFALPHRYRHATSVFKRNLTKAKNNYNEPFKETNSLNFKGISCQELPDLLQVVLDCERGQKLLKLLPLFLFGQALLLVSKLSDPADVLRQLQLGDQALLG